MHGETVQVNNSTNGIMYYGQHAVEHLKRISTGIDYIFTNFNVIHLTKKKTKQGWFYALERCKGCWMTGRKIGGRKGYKTYFTVHIARKWKPVLSWYRDYRDIAIPLSPWHENLLSCMQCHVMRTRWMDEKYNQFSNLFHFSCFASSTNRFLSFTFERKDTRKITGRKQSEIQ